MEKYVAKVLEILKEECPFMGINPAKVNWLGVKKELLELGSKKLIDEEAFYSHEESLLLDRHSS